MPAAAGRQQHQGHNKEGMPITEGTKDKAEVPATAHPEQQGHQRSVETPTEIRTSTSAGSTPTAETPTLARLQVTDRMSVNAGHWQQQGLLMLLTAGMPVRLGIQQQGHLKQPSYVANSRDASKSRETCNSKDAKQGWQQAGHTPHSMDTAIIRDKIYAVVFVNNLL
jgi:hypothetical protein